MSDLNKHPLVLRARAYAEDRHGRIEHRRKYSGEPYVLHLERVADLVGEACEDPAAVAAAWLHDVVEDTPATHAQVLREFGPEVAALVHALTDEEKAVGNRAHRKALDRARLASAEARVHSIKLADLVDNLDDICAHDPNFARVFLKEAEALLPLLHKGAPHLHDRAVDMAKRCRKRLRALSNRAATQAPRTSAGSPAA